MEGTLPQKFTESYKKSEVIFSENSPGKDMYNVYSGKVGLYQGEKESMLIRRLANDCI
jgi:CRP-like cAMP-binding protein